MEESVKFFANKYEEVLSNPSSLEKTIAERSKKVPGLPTEMETEDDEIKQMKIAINDLELCGRENNIEIHRVEQNENENTISTLGNIANKLGLPTPATDSIESMHKLKTRMEGAALFLVRFRDRNIRDMWIAKTTVH